MRTHDIYVALEMPPELTERRTDPMAEDMCALIREFTESRPESAGVPFLDDAVRNLAIRADKAEEQSQQLRARVEVLEGALRKRAALCRQLAADESEYGQWGAAYDLEEDAKWLEALAGSPAPSVEPSPAGGLTPGEVFRKWEESQFRLRAALAERDELRRKLAEVGRERDEYGAAWEVEQRGYEEARDRAEAADRRLAAAVGALRKAARHHLQAQLHEIIGEALRAAEAPAPASPPSPWSSRYDGNTMRYSKPGAPNSFLAHDAGGNSITWRNADTPIEEIVALLRYHASRPRELAPEDSNAGGGEQVAPTGARGTEAGLGLHTSAATPAPAPAEEAPEAVQAPTPEQARAELLDVLPDMLSLVMEHPPTREQLAPRKLQELVEAENWAALSHLAASDNPVPVPAMPAWLESPQAPEPASFLQRFKTSAPQHWQCQRCTTVQSMLVCYMCGAEYPGREPAAVRDESVPPPGERKEDQCQPGSSQSSESLPSSSGSSSQPRSRPTETVWDAVADMIDAEHAPAAPRLDRFRALAEWWSVINGNDPYALATRDCAEELLAVVEEVERG